MVQAIKKAFSVIFFLLPVVVLTGCFGRGSDSCTETSVVLPFPEEFKDWFKQAGEPGTTIMVPVQTASGLKESVILSKLVHQEGVLGPANNCNNVTGQVINLGYNSSVYGLSSSLSLLQQAEGEKPVLRINNYYQQGDDYLFSQMLVSLGGSTTYPVTLTRTKPGQTSENIQTNSFPEVSVTDSLVIGSKVYRQVYKISDLYLKQHGQPYFITDFFVDKAYGLVQYAQKDGTTWQLQF